MKARIPPKHRLTKEILDVAVREAKRQADEQIDDVCKRCTNEFYVAMHQAGLSPKNHQESQHCSERCCYSAL